MDNLNVKIFDVLRSAHQKYGDKEIFAAKRKGEWIKFSVADYHESALNVSYGLISLGLKPGDRIITVSENRPEWNFVDLGAQQAGIIHVPVYPTIRDEELTFIINETEASVVFVSGKYLFGRLSAILDKVPLINHIYSFAETEGCKHFSELTAIGKDNPSAKELEIIQDNIDRNDCYTILYTSGTTGDPKGVMLTHNSHLPVIQDLGRRVGPEPGYKALSYLPLNHVFERTVCYMYQLSGVSIYYSDGVANILNNFQEVKPDVLSTVPLLMERIYGAIVNFGQGIPDESKPMYERALNYASSFDPNTTLSTEMKAFHEMADQHVFSKWRGFLGGNLKRVMCGGAAMQEELWRLYWAMGLTMLNGYGLSETSGLVSIDRAGSKIKINKSGMCMDTLEVRIADDGEILARGINIMKGYYRNPELTSQTIDADGWLATGDLGVIDEEGYIEYKGRKRAYFKTSAGRYVNPELIENQLKQSPFVSQVLVAGSDRSFLVALIIPDFVYIEKWLQNQVIPFVSKEDVIKKENVIAEIQKAIDEYNKHHFDTELILKYKLICSDWTIDGGELTPSMKLKRNVLLGNYKLIIDEIYHH